MSINAYSANAKRSLGHYFLPFMLLFSLGLHGLILFVPTAPGNQESVPPPDAEEDGITVTKTAPPTFQRPAPSTARDGAANPAATSTRTNPSARVNPSSTRPPNGARTNTASNNTQGNNRPATTNRPLRSTVSARDRSPQATSTTNSRTPAPPTVSPLNNPNPTPPTPNSGAVAGRRQFLSYADIFATYQGPTSLTAEVVADRQSIWLSSFTAQGNPYSSLEIQPLSAIEPISYEAKICLPSAPNTAELLVLVEADGTVNGDIMTLQSTGYRQFNQAALAMAQQHSYPSSDRPQAYLVPIKVDYDQENCQWPPTGTNLPDEYFTLLQSYVGPTSTTLSEAQVNQAKWLDAVVRDGAITSSEVTVLEDFQERVAYVNNICLPIEPEEARLGVVVDADGNLIDKPKQLRSTGYTVFDDRAQALVEAFDFPSTEAPQAYVVKVQTAYNGVNCQPLTSQTFELTVSNATVSAVSPHWQAQQ